MSIFSSKSKKGASPLPVHQPASSAPTRQDTVRSTPESARNHHVPSTKRGSRDRPNVNNSQPQNRRAPSTTEKASPVKRRDTQRPGLERKPTVQTRYVEMLLSLDQIPRLHNILASFFTWILLAGYIVFPATFTSLQNNDEIQSEADRNVVEAKILGQVKNAPLLYIASFCCGIGCVGMVWLWWIHRTNYVWVINRIFLPGLMNSIAGLISTLVNIYSAESGQYSVTAKVTVIVTAACSAVTAAFFLLYNNLALSFVKKKHQKEQSRAEARMSEEAQRANGTEHHGMMDSVRRKAHQPGAEPMSVV